MEKKVVLKLNKVDKYYGEHIIFKNLNLEVGQEVHAVVANNGEGKTSLIRMLAGFENPTKGKIKINMSKKGASHPKDPSQMGIFKMAYAGQDDYFLENLSVKQNIVLGNEPVVAAFFPNWKAAELKINNLMIKYKIKLNLNKKVENLAIEELKKLSLLRALFKEPKILLLDEPTVGLSDSQKSEFWMIFKTFRAENITVLFTTRDEEFAKAVASKVSWIKDQTIIQSKNIKAQDNPKLFATNYWQNVIQFNKPKVIATVPMLYIDNLTCNKPLLPNFNNLEFAICAGEIYGIYDYENLYSEILVDSIVRLNKTRSGRVVFKEEEITYFSTNSISKLKIDWVPGQYYNKTVIDDATLSENFTFWNYHKPQYVTKTGVIKKTVVNNKIRKIIAEYNIFNSNDGNVKINKLSRGELQKFVLARSIEEEPQLLILSNPFSDLDQASAKLIIEKLLALQSQGTAILIIDSDPYLLELLCQRVAIIYNHQFVAKLENENVTAKTMINPVLWQDYPISNEIIIKTDKMYSLPQTKWSVRKTKINQVIKVLTKPFIKVQAWINKKLENIRSRLG